MHALRSALTAGMAAVTATAVVAAPAINPTPAAAQPVTVSIPVHNTAAATKFTPWDGRSTDELGIIEDQPLAPGLAATSAQLLALATNPSSGLIMDAYNIIEPWVRYGFRVATWAVGWVPWVGLLSGQIMILYNTGEPIVRSLFQSAQDLVKLNLSNIPAELVNGIATAAHNFVQGQLNWIGWFLPPLPPIGRAALAPTAAGLNSDLAAATTALAGRTLTLPNGSNLADFGKKITEGIHDLVDRTALKNLTSGNPLSLTGTPEKVAKVEVKPTVAIEAAEIEEADATTPPPVVEIENARPSVRGSGSLQSLRDLKLPTLKGNGAWKKAKETKDADPQIIGEPSVTLPSTAGKK